MSVKVNLTPHFNDIVKGNECIEANGRTIREVIEDIDKRFPGFKKELIDPSGRVPGFFEIYINQESAFPNELTKKVADNDEITFLTVVGGG